MRKSLFSLLGAAFLLAFVWVGIFYFETLQGIGPALRPPPGDITEIINTTGMPLSLPQGFSIEVFAEDLPGARVMAFDTFNNLWVSQTSEGILALLEIQEGKVVNQGAILNNLQKPHGLIFDPRNEFSLYYAEEDKISRIPVYSDGEPERIIDLPVGDRHFTRTLGFGPDGRLYVSVGSTCDVCNEEDPYYAAISSMRADGSDFRQFARGLRNAVFFTWHPETDEMWATEMGRDWLGDDLPPDEINIIREGGNYGWPICYGENIHDTAFDKNIYIRAPCTEPFEVPSYIDVPAHSAPLGLAFIHESEKWPREYWNNLLVAYHGSWNRNKPTGYKVVRYKLDAEGGYVGEEDFISGWLTPEGALGRPADLKIGPDEALYISDDKAGVIYKVLPPPN